MKRISLIIPMLFLAAIIQAQKSASKNIMHQLIKENFALADTQYRYMMSLTPLGSLPQSFEEKNNNPKGRNMLTPCEAR